MVRKDASGKSLPGWMQPEKPWKQCDGCLNIRQTDKKKCSCGGLMKPTDKPK